MGIRLARRYWICRTASLIAQGATMMHAATAIPTKNAATSHIRMYSPITTALHFLVEDEVVPRAGVEPATVRLGGGCSVL